MKKLKNQPLEQFALFPSTRYMGSKNKIILNIWEYIRELEFDSVLDAFGGSNVVGYFLKCQGKRVISNDFLTFSSTMSKAIIENPNVRLSQEEVTKLLKRNKNNGFIEKTFDGIFYNKVENQFLDRVRKNINSLENEYQKALALSSLVRACLKKRSRGVFTFVGERYNDGRADMIKSLEEHFLEGIEIFNQAVFSNNKKNIAKNQLVHTLKTKPDLVYLDPPYYNPTSDNDYTRRYHFIEGLVKEWKDLTIQDHTLVKKFESYNSPFSKKASTYIAFESLFEKFRESIIVVSYSSNSIPSKEELYSMLSNVKDTVTVFEIDHTYSFGNQNHKKGNINNRVKEYLFIAQ